MVTAREKDAAVRRCDHPGQRGSEETQARRFGSALAAAKRDLATTGTDHRTPPRRIWGGGRRSDVVGCHDCNAGTRWTLSQRGHFLSRLPRLPPDRRRLRASPRGRHIARRLRQPRGFSSREVDRVQARGGQLRGIAHAIGALDDQLVTRLAQKFQFVGKARRRRHTHGAATRPSIIEARAAPSASSGRSASAGGMSCCMRCMTARRWATCTRSRAKSECESFLLRGEAHDLDIDAAFSLLQELHPRRGRDQLGAQRGRFRLQRIALLFRGGDLRTRLVDLRLERFVLVRGARQLRGLGTPGSRPTCLSPAACRRAEVAARQVCGSRACAQAAQACALSRMRMCPRERREK